MKLVSRSDWGGPATIGNPTPVRQGIAVHYEGPPTGLASEPHSACVSKVRAIHEYHRDVRGWSGIGYAWLVCPHGWVIEGRGADRTQAAQVGGNSTHQAVQFMVGGDEQPTAGMLTAWFDLRAFLFNEAGVGSEVRPHNSWNATSCPGAPVMALLDDGTLTGPRTGPGGTTPPPGSRATYTVQPGDSLWSISREHGVTVDELREWNSIDGDLIHPGDVLFVEEEMPELVPVHFMTTGAESINDVLRLHSDLSLEEFLAANGRGQPEDYELKADMQLVVRFEETEPEPDPEPEPEPEPDPDPYANGLPRMNQTSPSARALQAELKRVGYMSTSIAPADNYGPKTQESVGEFHAHNPELGASGAQISRAGWDLLRSKADGSGRLPGTGGGDDVVSEPPHDYRRVTYTGKTINVRTRIMLERAVEHLAEHYRWSPYLVQGSYNPGVSASAGTHDGGGVIDIRTSTMTRRGQDLCVQALRKAGFAAWLRLPPTFGTHIHAVAIGDRELSPAAQSQIEQWRNDTNGLANHGPDPAPDPYPSWTNKYR